MTRRRAAPRRVGRRRRYGQPTTYTGRPLWASLLAALLRGFAAGRTQTPRQPDTRAATQRKDP